MIPKFQKFGFSGKLIVGMFSFLGLVSSALNLRNRQYCQKKPQKSILYLLSHGHIKT